MSKPLAAFALAAAATLAGCVSAPPSPMAMPRQLSNKSPQTDRCIENQLSQMAQAFIGQHRTVDYPIGKLHVLRRYCESQTGAAALSYGYLNSFTYHKGDVTLNFR